MASPGRAKRFSERVVWITGASSGIGEALAYELAREGARLVLSSRRAEALEAVRLRCERPDAHVVLPFDMTALDELPDQLAHVLAALGRLDVLINNAGVSQRGLALDTVLEVDRKLMELDFFAPIALVKLVLPHMLARRTGQIVAIASVAGLVATPYRSTYSAAKAALIAFHDALRAELDDTGVQVSVVCPGFVQTEIDKAALTGDGTTSQGRHPLPPYALSAEAFARSAVSSLARAEGLSVVAGRERLLWWLSRVSPRLAAAVLRRVRVV